MKKIFILACAFSMLMISCKKDQQPSLPANNPNHSFSIVDNFEFEAGIWKKKGYMLLNINHDNNKDKSFMVVDIVNTGSAGFKFVIKRGPLPIDSLSPNFPTQVKSIWYGYSNDMFPDQYMRLLVSSIDNGKFTYRYDSIHKFPSSIYMVNYLHNATLYAGAMAGKRPDARTFSWRLEASGEVKPVDVIYYFKESQFTIVNRVGVGAQPLTVLENGFPTVTDHWKQVDAAFTLPGAYNNSFFFDFDKWRFFVSEDFCQPGGFCTTGVKYADYQSMNNLMDWPEGWAPR